MSTSSRPKVMHVVPGLGLGGAESMLASLVTAPRAGPPRQLVVNLLTSDRAAHNAKRIRDAGVPVLDLEMQRGRINLGAISRLAKLIRRERPDVIQSWMYHADLIATLALRRSGRRPATRFYWGVRCSDGFATKAGPKLRLVIRACRRLSHVPDAVVANSEAGRKAHEEMGYRPRAFPVVRNGIDVERFRADPDARRAVRKELGLSPTASVVIRPARSDPMKDNATFIATVDQVPDVWFVATGMGTGSLPSRPNLITLGARNDMPRLYAAADLVMSTSAYGEGFSNALAEGMAAGLPAVTTDVGDAGRLVGDAGWVTPPCAAPALAKAVRAATHALDADKARHSGRARQRIVENFSLQKAVAAFDALHAGGELPELDADGG